MSYESLLIIRNLYFEESLHYFFISVLNNIRKAIDDVQCSVLKAQIVITRDKINNIFFYRKDALI